jgi:hypothetical protein
MTALTTGEERRSAMRSMSMSDVWAVLDERQQRETAESLWTQFVLNRTDTEDARDRGERIVAALRETTGFRDKGLRRLNSKQGASYLLKHINERRVRDLTVDLIREWILAKHLTMLVTFLDAAGIPHHRGMIESDEPPSVDQLRAGLREVADYGQPRASGPIWSTCCSA